MQPQISPWISILTVAVDIMNTVLQARGVLMNIIVHNKLQSKTRTTAFV